MSDSATSPALEPLVLPSLETIQATFSALKQSTEEIEAAGKSIMETCRMASDALSTLGMSGPSAGSTFGAIPLAINALAGTVSKYVEHKTGVSLKQWAQFVDTAETQFQEYLAQLGKLSELARRIEAVAGSAELPPEQLRKDKKLIEDTRLKTRLWRPMMARLPQLSHVIDSILESKSEPAQAVAPSEDKGGWGKRLKGAVDTVKDQIADEQELLKPLLAPIHEIRDRIGLLGGQVDKLADGICELDDLLDLQLAQIRVLLGELPERGAELLGQRVAVTIMIPRLKKRLEEAQECAAKYRGFLEKLEATRRNPGLSEKAFMALLAEYRADLESATARVGTLENEIGVWRGKAPGILEASRIWLKEEEETVKAREMVGQLPSEQARERLAGVRRELGRTEKATWLLAPTAAA